MVEKIKRDMISAMKSGDIISRDVLRVLRGEIQRGFITEDADVIKIVKKMIQNIKENGGNIDEIGVLENYLPKQMSKDEMIGYARTFIITNELKTPKEMGKVMGYFKNNFDGIYDGKELSGIVKNLLR